MLAPPAGATTPPLLFGAYPKPLNGLTPQQAVVKLESTIGRDLAVVREYDFWDSPFPTTFDTWLRDSGHIIALSVKALRTNQTRLKWIDIANAQPGLQLYNDVVGWADRVRALRGSGVVHLQPRGRGAIDSASGTAGFHRGMAEGGHDLPQEGVTNAKYVWVATSYAF